MSGHAFSTALYNGAIPVTGGRLLATADVFRALTEQRPHRPAMSRSEAAAALERACADGRMDVPCTRAVLAAAGESRSFPRSVWPGVDRSGSGGPETRGGRAVEQEDRRSSDPVAQDSGPACRAHLRQDRRLHPGRSHAVRDGSGIDRRLTERWGVHPMRGALFSVREAGARSGRPGGRRWFWRRVPQPGQAGSNRPGHCRCNGVPR